jgi:hypothetical protein
MSTPSSRIHASIWGGILLQCEPLAVVGRDSVEPRIERPDAAGGGVLGQARQRQIGLGIVGVGGFLVPRLLGEETAALGIRGSVKLGGARCAARALIGGRYHADTAFRQRLGQRRKRHVLVPCPTIRPFVTGGLIVLAALVDVADMVPVACAL